MTDKQFEQIECVSKKLWEDINNGHEYSMVTYTEFLGIVTEVWEGLQEEPASEFLNTESMIESYKQRLISQPNGLRSPLIDMCLASYKHGINETLDTLNLSNVQRTAKNWEEPVSDDLGDYINELSKQFPEVSFAKLSRIAVRVAKWQEEKDELTWEDIEAIDDIFTDVFKDGFDAITNEYYQEVLKRFNKERKEK